ncbi:MAG: Membrane protein required for N-linked glycosylation [Cenarchaeum symbiont of Oopsacas minuta]|nr:Membrane protein required for N-linked glycosylation [Cenarchaeum symbiont of Oopsacas minuta]
MYYHHLLVIAVLALAVSMSAMVRSYPLEYGYELNEFDPFYNYRVTDYIIENGVFAYKDWHDDKVWYPTGRDISATSQEMLHYTAAGLYTVFGGNMPLYDFLIPLPLIFGALTSIAVFAMVRVIGGTTAGMLASMFFAISVPIINRGTIGWFKSEPLGLFYGVIGMYFLLSGIKSNNKKTSIIKLVLGGVFITFGLSAWGGIQFFIIPIGLFFLSLPFIRKDLKFIAVAASTFTISMFTCMLFFESGGVRELTSFVGLSIAAPTIFIILANILQKKQPKQYMRNISLLVTGFFIAGISAIMTNTVIQFLPSPTYRYLTAINPFLKSNDVLVQSVAEHATTTIQQSFSFFSVLLIFAGIGAWFMLANRDRIKTYLPNISYDMVVFSLTLAITGAYISSAFIRLELFATFAVITLASIAIAIISAEMFKPRISKKHSNIHQVAKIGFVIVIVALLITPTLTPVYGNWTNSSRGPPTLLNGGTSWGITNDDWPKTFEWIKTNTPEDAIIGSWWDYGYWLTTLADRTTLADNGTLSTVQISKIGRTMVSDPDEAWQTLTDWGVDYFTIFIVAQKIQDEPPLYFLRGGGDESKKVWFIRIGGEDLRRYVYGDGFSGTDYFWDSTLLGSMIPFSISTYYNQQTGDQSPTYRSGYTGIYHKDIKYPSTGDGPLKLAYVSDSFREDHSIITAVLIYEVNKDYVPTITPKLSEVEQNTARVTTSLGQFIIELDRDAAPNTVQNFVNLTKAGVYDNTLFHRIIPDYILQGGDPNTKYYGRDAWGFGDPGYNIDIEYNELSHTKYAISMARTDDVNSAGSQFFIMLENSTQLDGQYTVFGRVTSGQNVIDRLGAINTTDNDQPIQAYDAIVEKIEILR